jgi:hypothetical protein
MARLATPPLSKNLRSSASPRPSAPSSTCVLTQRRKRSAAMPSSTLSA